jgi:hypothetical protein
MLELLVRSLLVTSLLLLLLLLQLVAACCYHGCRHARGDRCTRKSCQLAVKPTTSGSGPLHNHCRRGICRVDTITQLQRQGEVSAKSQGRPVQFNCAGVPCTYDTA